MGAAGADIPRFTHSLDLDRESILNGFAWRERTEEEVNSVVSGEEEFAEGYLLEEEEVAEGYFEGMGDNLDLLCEDKEAPEDMGDKLKIFDRDLKISIKIDKFRMKISRNDLDELSTKFRKLDDQYAYLRPHLPKKYRRLFDRLIRFTEYVRIEKSTEPRNMVIGVNSKTYLMDKNALRLIKLMMPLAHLSEFLQQILDEKPP